jgi:CDP-paratose 2-epimerase
LIKGLAMKYLLIGGCGFIGCNFAEKLVESGCQVILADNLSRKGTIDNLQYLQNKYENKIVFEHLDIRCNYDKLLILIDKVDVVYHLAAQVAVTTSVKSPREDFEINALGTFNVVEAIRNSQRKPILLYASTNKVYGGMEDIAVVEKNNRYMYRDFKKGIPENKLLDFHSPYGCSKGVGDQYVKDYARIYGIKTVVLRQSCIYGKRQFGIEDQGWVAWFTIASLLDKQITVYGNGKQVRDVLYVDDLFEAWKLATDRIDEVCGEVFNIGGGIENTLSVLELLEQLEKRLKKKIDYKFSGWSPGDQPVYISDINKTYQLLQWQPKVSVEEGIGLMSEWIEDNIDLLRCMFA